MRARPVVADASAVLAAVAESIGEPVTLQGVLDLDVYRLARGPDVADLVVRAFGAGVPRASVDAAAGVLQSLASTRFPAERCGPGPAVLTIGADRHLLVTEFVEATPAPRPGIPLAWCAALLGRLATRPGAEQPPGGGWHRLGLSPSAEIDEALRLGSESGVAVAELVDALADADDGSDLPEALIHADLTPPNTVAQGDQAPVVIDWIGVGRGPRAWPLAFLLYVAGPKGAVRGLERYQRSVTLTDEERHRLPGLMIARPLTLDLWAVAHERLTVKRAISRFHQHRARCAAVAAALDS